MKTKRLLCALLLLVSATTHAAITGAVIDGDGRPIAGARVSLYAWESELAARTRLLSENPERVPLESVQADAKGSFSLPSPKDAVVFLDISARGYLPQRRTIERDEETGAIVLAKGEVKTATVTAAGKPVADAVVSVRYGQFEHTIRTDEKGQAEVPDIRRASSIAVIHPEYSLDYEAFVGRTPVSALRRTLRRNTPRNGRVVDLDGKTAVAGAAIYADGWPLATTGDDGTFNAKTPAKWTMLIARKGNNFGERSWQATGDLKLRMAKGTTITGRVTDAKSRMPVMLAQVIVTVRNGPTTIPVDGVTDAKGNFALHAPQGTYGLLAAHPGYAGQMHEVTLSAGEQASRDVALNPLSRLSGVIVTDGGKPVATASVARDMAMGSTNPWMMRDGVAAVTLADGRFTLRTAVEGEIRLRASKKGLPSATSDALRVAPGEQKSGILITMPAGVEVTGRVTDADDNPLSGVAIFTTEAQPGGRARPFVFGGPASADDDAPRTTSDGTYALRVKEGSWDFSFRRDGYATANVRGQRIAPGEPNEVDAEMEPAVELSGRVVRNGAGIEGVRIYAFNMGEPLSVNTAADGSFTLGGLAAGEVAITLRKPEEFIQEMKTFTAPARDVVIEVRSGEAVTGRVVEKGSRRPVTSFQAGMAISRSGDGMIMMGPPLLRSFTSEDGSFTLENIPTGAVNLVATAPGFVMGKVNLNIEEGKEVRDIEIELDRGVRVTGKVTSANGAALTDARVAVVPAPGAPLTAHFATTDVNGEYSIDALEPGEQTIEVRHQTGSARKTATLKAPSTRVDLQLEAAARVTGIVVDAGGSPVGDASVGASGGGRFASATSRADGTFELEGLAPGRYTFTAQKSGFAPARLPDFDISAGAPVRLTLGTGGTIFGRVTGVESRDLAQMQVQAFAAQTYLSSPVDPSGNYRIEGVPEGTFQVAAFLASRGFGRQKSSETQTITVEKGGSHQIDLEFRDDVVVRGRVTRNGVPLPGSFVSFEPMRGGAGSYMSATTDESGSYEVSGLSEGEHRVSVMDRQRFSSYKTTFTVRGSATFDIDYNAVGVRGRVSDTSSDEPVVTAVVELRHATLNESVRGDFSAATDSAGAFAFDLVPPGSYVLTVAREGFGNLVRDLSVGTSSIDNLELKLNRSDGVTLRVVDARDGRKLRGMATVMDAQGRIVYDSRSGFGWSTPDELRVPLSPGQYTAAISSGGYAPRMISFNAPSTQNVGLTPGGTLTIESKHPTHRRIVLVDESGRRYLYNPWDMGKIGLLPSPGITTIPNVAAGRYTVQLLSEDENSVVDSVQVVVPEGGTAQAEL